MTIEQFFKYLAENKDKIYEINFGGYWIQMPFGLIMDMIEKTYEYCIEEQKNEFTD